MDKFAEILQRAEQRKGGKAALLRALPPLASQQQLAALGNDRYLAEMTRSVFQAGFIWRVVNQKWADFERVFLAFDPLKLVRLSDEQLESISNDVSIIRNHKKIYGVPKNARMILDLEQEQQESFAHSVQHWPTDNLIELFSLWKRRGDRLGGNTGPRTLRNLGIDTYLLSKDVTRCLQAAGVQIRTSPTSKGDLRLIQTAFNTWHRETGLPYSHLSCICAWSIGENNPLENFHPNVIRNSRSYFNTTPKESS